MRIACISLLTCAAYAVCQTQPGALVHALGRIKVTEDVVTLRYNLHALGDIPYGILTVKNNLLATRAKLFSDDEHTTDLFDHVTDILIQINLLMDRYGGPPPARALRRGRRVRRGLFDAAGILSKALFGTATEKDVDALKEKVSALAGLGTRNTRTMRLVYKHFTQVESTMLDITKKTNQLLVLSRNYTREIAELWNHILITGSVNRVERALGHFERATDTLMTDLTNAQRGIVTTSMLPVNDLRAALDEGITHYHLSALYKLTDLGDYYRIIESSLGKNYFLIHIPMCSDVVYNAFHMIPFPLRLESRTVQLASGDRIFLMNDELTTVDVLNVEVLEQCKQDVNSDYICPAFPFHFHQAVDHECEIALVQNNTQKALKQCTYSVFKEEYFQRHFYGFNYFYFQELTSVTVVCVDDPTMVEVLGYYKAPDYCRILTRLVMTSPSRHHLALIKNISIDIPVFEAMFNVAFPHIELPVANISLLSVYMNDSDLAEAIQDNLPFMTDHAFYWPVLSTQYILSIVCAVVMGCLFHKLMVKYDIVSHRLDPH